MGDDDQTKANQDSAAIQLKFKKRKPRGTNYNQLLGGHSSNTAVSHNKQSIPIQATPPEVENPITQQEGHQRPAVVDGGSAKNASVLDPRVQEFIPAATHAPNMEEAFHLQQQKIADLEKQLEALKLQVQSKPPPALTNQITEQFSVSSQEPKKSGVWAKNKVWTPPSSSRPQTHCPDEDVANPEATAQNFLTKSEKQGRMYRDANNANGRKALENELFGKERHMSAGLDFDKYDSIPVESSGHEIPEPINSFAEAGFCEELMVNIERANYTRPTPIQKHAIPMSMNGRDVMACAQTGSGKTAAFLFPIINQLIKSRHGRRSYTGGHRKATPGALVLAPTRELASQIHDEAMRFTYQSAIRCVVVYGGADIRSQMDELSKGCGIIVATPGRLEDLIERKKVSLEHVKFLVLDEADRMLDLGFEPQIRKIVTEYNMPLTGRHTAMFSATFPTPIQQLAGDFMADYIFVSVGRVGSANQSITQNLLWVEDEQKYDKLVEMLCQIEGLTLVFVETKRTAELLHGELYRRNKFSVTSIHGDRSQREREQALWAFTTRQCPVLVATEVAARGLDIPEVMHVINYDMPSEIDSYVHRIGRTGRAGNTGVATSFINERNMNIAGDLLKICEETNIAPPPWLPGLAAQAQIGRGGRNNRGGHSRFGGRDYRRDQGSHANTSAPMNTVIHDASRAQHSNKDDTRSTSSGQSKPRRGGRGRNKGHNKAPPAPTDAW